MLKDDKTIIEGVLAEFLEMCRYPHGSYNEKPLVDVLQRRLESRGWPVERDSAGNLRADVPAAAGREGEPLTVIQGHVDMVCAVRSGSGYDPLTDPICARVENGMLCTDGRSSLGADNNLGNAAALYLLDQDVPHGPVRLIFTTAEEVGLVGVSQLAPNWLEGARYLINTDGFKLGQAVVSSAGGLRQTYEKEIRWSAPRCREAFSLRLGTSTGGHSGYDINKGRANCLKLLSLFLHSLEEEWELVSFVGGHALNAIPLEARAVIALDAGEQWLTEKAADFNRKIRSLYALTDPGVSLAVEPAPRWERVWSRDSRESLLDLLLLLTDGVETMHRTLPGLVAASCNLGVVREHDGKVEVDCFIRFTNAFYEDIIAARHQRAAARLGFACGGYGYPCWEGDGTNPLARLLGDVYRELTGEEMELTAVHVGLEPSMLGAKNPEMTMVVTGPTILDPHSVDERAPVEGLGTYVRLLAGALERIGEIN